MNKTQIDYLIGFHKWVKGKAEYPWREEQELERERYEDEEVEEADE